VRVGGGIFTRDGGYVKFVKLVQMNCKVRYSLSKEDAKIKPRLLPTGQTYGNPLGDVEKL
jgi:hypothetical protein